MKKTVRRVGIAALLVLVVIVLLLARVRAKDGAGAPAQTPKVGVLGRAEPTPAPTPAPLAEIELRGEKELTLEYGEDFADPGAEAWLLQADGTRGEALEVRVSPAPDTAKLGVTELVYSAVRGEETLASATRRVTVRDSVAPVLTLAAGPDEPEYSAVDNVDGDISERVERREEADRIVYTVRDSSGNEARAERSKAPLLILEGGESVQIPADYRFVDPGYTAMDAYGRDLSDRVQVEGQITPWRLGSYQLSYSLTDDEGRTVTAQRTVEIVKAEMPETVLQEKVIYLTFDDGPAGPTSDLLDLLAKYDAKVTFFVTNTDPRYTDMIGRAYREGHSIGLHAYAHDASKIYTSEENYFYYFDLMEELIHEQTGEYTRIVRFVGGSSNTSSTYFASGIMTRLAEDLTNMGYRYYDWNLQPENDTCNAMASYHHIVSNAEFICREAVTVPISLQHDTAGWNIGVVEMVLQWGLANGYQFKGIDMTTPEVHHLIRN